jgi:hypothetical protein
MTVCIAAIYRNVYDADLIAKEIKDAGPAVLTASDRMLTVENLGIEYEPFAYKWSHVAKRILVLVADNVTVHSELLQRCQPEIRDKDGENEATVGFVADLYARRLREFKAQRAEQYALSLYGLSTAEFIDKQNSMAENIVVQIANQMQETEQGIRAEALVVGVDPDNTAHIYYMDSHGLTHCYDDVGFAAIGTGNIHANHQFMMHSYANTFGYYPALMLIYAAKKSAEIAPSVGKATDMAQITRDGTWSINVNTMKSLEKRYAEYDRSRKRLEKNALDHFMKDDAIHIANAVAKKPATI